MFLFILLLSVFWMCYFLLPFFFLFLLLLFLSEFLYYCFFFFRAVTHSVNLQDIFARFINLHCVSVSYLLQTRFKLYTRRSVDSVYHVNCQPSWFQMLYMEATEHSEFSHQQCCRQKMHQPLLQFLLFLLVLNLKLRHLSPAYLWSWMDTVKRSQQADKLQYRWS